MYLNAIHFVFYSNFLIYHFCFQLFLKQSIVNHSSIAEIPISSILPLHMDEKEMDIGDLQIMKNAEAWSVRMEVEDADSKIEMVEEVDSNQPISAKENISTRNKTKAVSKKIYTCERCGYITGNRKERLDKHQQLYCKVLKTGAPKFPCPVCHQEYPYDLLRAHLRYYTRLGLKYMPKNANHAALDVKQHEKILHDLKQKFKNKTLKHI